VRRSVSPYSASLLRIVKSDALVAGDTAKAFADIAREAASTLSVERVGVWMMSEARDRIFCVASADRAGRARKADIELRQSDFPNFFEALSSNRVIDADDARADPRTADLAAGRMARLGVTAMLDAPIHIGADPIGIVSIEHGGAPRHWTAEEIAYACSVADLLARGVEAERRRRAEAALRTARMQVQDVEERLLASQRRLQDFAEVASDWFWETDADLRFTYFSAHRQVKDFGFQRFIGKTRNEVGVGMEPDAAWEAHLATLRRREPFSDFRYAITDGRGRRLQITVSGRPVFDADGAFIGYRGTGADVTEQWEAEQARLAALEAEKLANDAKSSFLATMSHELRTPLNAILGFNELMRNQVFGPLGDDRYRGYVDDIHRSGRHLLSMIDDILDLAKIEAGARTVDLVAVPLDALLGDASRQCAPLIEEKRLAFTGPTVDRDLAILADRRAAIQVLLNLLSNAVKFTPSGGAIEITATPEPGTVRISVKDTGIGIAAGSIARVSEPFTQLRHQPYLAQSGAGLGLSIVKSLMADQGGALEIDSKPGVGTAVTVIFRRAAG